MKSIAQGTYLRNGMRVQRSVVYWLTLIHGRRRSGAG